MLKKYQIWALLALVAHPSSQEIHGVETEEQVVSGISLSQALAAAEEAIAPAFNNRALSEEELKAWDLLDKYDGLSDGSNHKTRIFIKVCRNAGTIDEEAHLEDDWPEKEKLLTALADGNDGELMSLLSLDNHFSVVLSGLIDISERLNPEKELYLHGIKYIKKYCLRKSRRGIYSTPVSGPKTTGTPFMCKKEF